MPSSRRQARSVWGMENIMRVDRVPEGVDRFLDNDDGFLAWRAQHPIGYVVVTDRVANHRPRNDRAVGLWRNRIQILVPNRRES